MMWLLGLLGLSGAGIGAAFLFGGGPALLLFGRAALGFLAKIPWWAYAAAAILGLIAFLAISRGHWVDRARADETQLASICAATRTAAANPKLDCKLTAKQIQLLGENLKTAHDALANSNAAVNAQAAETARQKQIAAEADKLATQRAKAIQAVEGQLIESSRHSPPPGAPCLPSKVLQEQWR